MKIEGIFESLLEPIFLHQCFRKAARGKRGRIAVARYATELETNIEETLERLHQDTYDFGPYRAFEVHEPKRRLIESACFPDRIVHQAIYARLEPLYDPCFYRHSYACRTGHGSHAAMYQVKNWLRDQNMRFYLKCDIKKYFQSIDREILLNILKKKIGDDRRLFLLIEKLIRNAPHDNGIPIGNLTSQLFANIYLNELDLFVKRQLGVKKYIRYMDDFVLLTANREEAVQFRHEIEAYLQKKLKLTLSPHKVRIAKVADGISFVGYRIFPDRVKLRSAGVRRARRKIFRRFRNEDFGQSPKRDPFTVARLRNSTFHGAWCSFVGQVSYCSNGAGLALQVKDEIMTMWKKTFEQKNIEAKEEESL